MFIIYVNNEKVCNVYGYSVLVCICMFLTTSLVKLNVELADALDWQKSYSSIVSDFVKRN